MKKTIFIDNADNLILMEKDLKKKQNIYVYYEIIDDKEKMWMLATEETVYVLDLESIKNFNPIKTIISNLSLEEENKPIFVGFDLEELIFILRKKYNIFLYPIYDIRILSKIMVEINDFESLRSFFLEKEDKLYFTPLELGHRLTKFNISGQLKYLQDLEKIDNMLGDVVYENDIKEYMDLAYKTNALEIDIYRNGLNVDFKEIKKIITEYESREIVDDPKARDHFFQLKKLEHLYEHGRNVTGLSAEKLRVPLKFWGADLKYSFTDLDIVKEYITPSKGKVFYTIKYTSHIKDDVFHTILMRNLIYQCYFVIVSKCYKNVKIVYTNENRIVFELTDGKKLKTYKDNLKLLFMSVLSLNMEDWDLITYEEFI